MKKYLITSVVVLIALAIAWPVLGQREGSGAAGQGGEQGQGRAGQRGGQGLSEEERAQMREKMQNMSEEEREKFRTQMRERMGASGRMMSRMSSEEQLKAIKTIEEQLAKLKASIETQASRPTQSMQDMSEEERTKLRDQMRTIRQEQQTALKTIVTQIALLQGQRQPTAEGEEFIIINTGQLKAIQELAVKEKAKETSDSITALLQPPQRGAGRGRQGQGQGSQDQPGEPGGRQRQQQQQEAGAQGGGV